MCGRVLGHVSQRETVRQASTQIAGLASALGRVCRVWRPSQGGGSGTGRGPRWSPPAGSPLPRGPAPNSVGFLLSPSGRIQRLGSLPRQGLVLRLTALSAGPCEANLVRSQGQEDKNHDSCQGDGAHKER